MDNIEKVNPNRTSILNFTKDQQKAYDELITFINAEYNDKDYKRALCGPAGTGKTYLVKALINNCNLSYSTINVAAPTHKAGRILNESINISNIQITTVASDLGFRPNYDSTKFDYNNPPFDTKGKIKILERRPKLYIVDEASMIDRGAFTYIEKFCKQIKCKIIYIGDSFQLPPVGELYSPAFKNVKTYFLKEIVRQGENNPITYLLDLLRFDIEHKTFNFLNYITKNTFSFNDDLTKGYQVLGHNNFCEKVKVVFNDEQLQSNVDLTKIIAFTNNVVNSWNNVVRNTIIKDSDISVITKNDLILSYITIVDEFNSIMIENSEEYILQDVINYVHPDYNIKGFMCRFVAIHGGQVTPPLFVVDHKDLFSVQMYYKISNSLIDAAKSANSSSRAAKWKEYYKFKESCLLLTPINNAKGDVLFGRNLDYGFALTAHKSQGSTFDITFVDVNDIVFDRYGHIYGNTEEINRRLYVACSRAKNKLYLKYGT